MDSPDLNNLNQHETDNKNMQMPQAPRPMEPGAWTDSGRLASRGFSLNITLRWRPFAFAIDVTPAPAPDRRLGQTI